MRVYIGCGSSPIKGWLNFDNSLTVRLARVPLVDRLVRSSLRKEFIKAIKTQGIKWADATKHIPVPDRSVEVLYTCHMVEHLDRDEVQRFLREAQRVLKSGGILRVAVPDLRKCVDDYLSTGNADRFIEDTYLAIPKPKTLTAKILHLFNGHRNHHWMYDSASMSALLSSAGFSEINVLEPGMTTIPDPGELNLYERDDVTLYVEAVS